MLQTGDGVKVLRIQSMLSPIEFSETPTKKMMIVTRIWICYHCKKWEHVQLETDDDGRWVVEINTVHQPTLTCTYNKRIRSSLMRANL